MISSPYYFIPFADSEPPVFLPEGADRVSQDYPFQDGMSGWLEVELEATTPIYIRSAGDHREYRGFGGGFFEDVRSLISSHPRMARIPRRSVSRHREFQKYVAFHAINGRPAIPGTSLKGPIRTILQVLTKGRCEPVNSRRYSMRDLDSQDYKKWFKGGARAGFVTWDDMRKTYMLTPCDFAKVLQDDLERFAQKKNLTVDLGSKQTVASKYEQWTLPLTQQLFVDGDQAATESIGARSVRYTGTLVFSGQPGDRMASGSAKRREYFFFGKRPNGACPISEEVWQGFLDAHENTNRVPSDTWEYWKDRLKSEPAKELPVFYLAHTSKEGGKTVAIDTPDALLHSIGLSLLYRLPYRNSLHDALPTSHRPINLSQSANVETESTPPHVPDFPSLLLGHVSGNTALRGRVQFGHLKKTATGGQMETVITVLGGPQPGYYPNYMVGGRTLMDPASRLRGWKFYAARPDGFSPVPSLPPGGEAGPNLDVATAFEPLIQGSKFRGKVRFHNLRPFELGSLIWALTWGGRGECRHRLGMAKPLGYGCAKIGIVGGEVIPNRLPKDREGAKSTAMTDDAIKEFCQNFETWLSGQPGMESWLQSDTVKTLLSLARHDHGVGDNRLCYPVLNPDKGINEFRDFKQARGTLPDWLILAPARDFGLWPEWMLPRPAVPQDPNALPGDHLLGAARTWEDPPQRGEVYRCDVIKATRANGKIRLRIVDGPQPDAEGILEVHGEIGGQVFDLLEAGRNRIVAKLLEGGGKGQWRFSIHDS